MIFKRLKSDALYTTVGFCIIFLFLLVGFSVVKNNQITVFVSCFFCMLLYDEKYKACELMLKKNEIGQDVEERGPFWIFLKREKMFLVLIGCVLLVYSILWR